MCIVDFKPTKFSIEMLVAKFTEYTAVVPVKTVNTIRAVSRGESELHMYRSSAATLMDEQHLLLALAVKIIFPRLILNIPVHFKN